jgi:hypothetical protein
MYAQGCTSIEDSRIHGRSGRAGGLDTGSGVESTSSWLNCVGAVSLRPTSLTGSPFHPRALASYPPPPLAPKPVPCLPCMDMVFPSSRIDSTGSLPLPSVLDKETLLYHAHVFASITFPVAPPAWQYSMLSRKNPNLCSSKHRDQIHSTHGETSELRTSGKIPNP